MATKSSVAKKRAKVTFAPYDPIDYFESEEYMVAYLEACMEEAVDDAAFIAHALGDIARKRGMTQLAQETGLTREGLYKALTKDGNPSFGTILKVMRALGLKFVPQKA